MTVFELRSILDQKPDALTQSEFDALKVLISNDGVFHMANLQNTGVSQFAGGTDDNGKDITDVPTALQLTFFTIVSDEFIRVTTDELKNEISDEDKNTEVK